MLKPKIVVVGCGIVGAMVAYELSARSPAEIYVLDKQQPAQESTGAALGVLMGAISGKVKGRTWRLRESSVRRYETLLSELSKQGHNIPGTRGIVSLCFDESKMSRWASLREKREQQGWPLEIWSLEELKERCPQVNLASSSAEEKLEDVKAAIYSPKDGQIQPVPLVKALISVAESRGVSFHWNTEVIRLNTNAQRCTSMQILESAAERTLEADWVVLTAGLGSAALTSEASEPLALMPVLGQAAEIQLPKTLGHKDFQPVINGDDIQFVPLGKGRYWIGATVEFPREEAALEAQANGIEDLLKGGARFCGAIAHAKIIKTWSGLRPRPVGQPAPVIKPLGNIENVTLATGHYRNGVLLAPATALSVCQLLAESGLTT